jgi:hypothetical protein
MMPQRLKTLSTYNDVLEKLGGPSEVGKICDQNPNAACTWRKARGKFPSKYYFVMIEALRDRGYWADRSLWGFHSKGVDYRAKRKTKQADAA